MQTVYIVRHGQTDFNLNSIMQGSGVDSSLNETGRQQAEAFYQSYKDVPFEVVLTSGLQRTHQSVRGFIDDGIPWEQHATINEMSWGVHEGKKTSPETLREYQLIKDGWALGEIDGRIGGGESAREMGARLEIFLDHLRQRPEEKILVCSHGRAMCGLISLMKGLGIDQMNAFKHSNLGLWKATLNNDGTYTFQLENDRSHLTTELQQL